MPRASTKSSTPPPKPSPREVLKAARRAAGLTQRQLADRAGLHTNTISNYERGTWELKASAGIALAHALGISPAQLLPGVVADDDNLALGQVLLYRHADDDGAWLAEGAAVDGPRKVWDRDLVTLIRSLIGRGIEVVVPVFPPVA